MDQKLLIVDASNVNTGGGLVLLNGMIEEASSFGTSLIFYVDKRASVISSGNGFIEFVKPNAIRRLICKFSIAFRAVFSPGEATVLSFGNFPNPFWRGRQITYVHNYFLVGNDWRESVKSIARFRLMLKRATFRILNAASTSDYMVQTATMASATRAVVGRKKKVSVVPVMTFSHLSTSIRTKRRKDGEAVFCYVSLGGENKNHLALVSAWKKLAERGYCPKLIITLESHIDHALYAGQVEKLIEEFLPHVVNLGKVAPNRVVEIYSESDALIFPSFTESFGLGLIEAAASGLDIIASDRSYVYDVVSPDYVFDPTDVESIVAAVIKYVDHGVDAEKKKTGGMIEKIVNPAEFLKKCQNS